ncbi:unnamed protein product [Owenia fusiformis]|uniref:Methyltransferase domain-containing protein n=1 Tax=Owenia fusiformis TaxID=6347 RepID=A0A8J1XXK9_OWEFU|nr:unnamed protein product [Owenia fusiformis]
MNMSTSKIHAKAPKIHVDYATADDEWKMEVAPEIFAKGFPCQQINALTILKEAEWCYEKDKVLDIGCGIGRVTREVLLTDQIEQITAFDIIPSYSKYAKEQNSHEKITFMQLDAGHDWPDKWKGTFDKVFSNECLNMVTDQEKLVKQIFNTLKPGGEFAASYFLRVDAFQIAILTLMAQTKWQKYFSEDSDAVEKAMETAESCPWTDENTFAKFLENAGFNVKKCQKIQTWYRPNDYLEWVQFCGEAYSRFYQQIPYDRQNEFAKELLPIILDIENKKLDKLSDKERREYGIEEGSKDYQCTEMLILHCERPLQ